MKELQDLYTWWRPLGVFASIIAILFGGVEGISGVAAAGSRYRGERARGAEGKAAAGETGEVVTAVSREALCGQPGVIKRRRRPHFREREQHNGH